MPSPTPHLILIGGFLGGGKTTAVQRLARSLGDQGLRVGPITNDQGSGLVDTEVQGSTHASRHGARGLRLLT